MDGLLECFSGRPRLFNIDVGFNGPSTARPDVFLLHSRHDEGRQAGTVSTLQQTDPLRYLSFQENDKLTEERERESHSSNVN